MRKRQKIAAELETPEDRTHGLVINIDAVDLTIRLFSLRVDVATIHVRPTPRRNGVRPADTSALLLSLPREYGPMSKRQIALKVMEHRRLSVVDRTPYGVIRNRVGASLRGLIKRGTLAQIEAASGGVRWELAT